MAVGGEFADRGVEIAARKVEIGAPAEARQTLLDVFLGCALRSACAQRLPSSSLSQLAGRGKRNLALVRIPPMAAQYRCGRRCDY